MRNEKTISPPFIMAPMVTSGYGIQDGFVTEQLAEHYRERAAGGIGMIIVEAACVAEDGKLTEPQIGIWKDEQIAGHKMITEKVHHYNIPVLLQIHHAGIRTVSGEPASPSNFDGILRGKPYHVKAMNEKQIKERIIQFIQAAQRARKAGYDGIELHCAHSYFLCGFLSPIVNRREDTYGGSLQGRMKIVLEILRSIRKECGDDFLISVRIGYDEPDLETSIKIAKILEQEKIDFLHISTGFGSSGNMDERTMDKAPDGFPLNIRLWGACQIKRHVDIPVIGVGGIRTSMEAKWMQEQGEVDYLALGRALLCDPQWVQKEGQEEDIAVCRNCRKCLWNMDYHMCPGWREYHGK